MNAQQHTRLLDLQGRIVHLALADGSRIDGAVLMYAGRRRVWLFLNGEDRFISAHDLIDVWETRPLRTAA
jgi:hypothetical protein